MAHRERLRQVAVEAAALVQREEMQAEHRAVMEALGLQHPSLGPLQHMPAAGVVVVADREAPAVALLLLRLLVQMEMQEQ
jgi:cyanate lyase